jgi:23S rRNA (pseudouridine1915-N3)-methyltransferase
LNVTVLAVGGVKGPLAAAVEGYESQLGHYWRYGPVEVEGGGGKGKKDDPGKVMAAEETRLLDRIPKDAVVVALTRDGKSLSSRELTRFLQEKALHSAPEVVFVIGGAFGLGPGILKRASLKLSLSRMTLPHEMARLLLVEQLYRAGTISRNEPYHKGP